MEYECPTCHSPLDSDDFCPKCDASEDVERFEDLPIFLDDYEVKDGWSRRILRQTTIAELLTTWDIDDANEQSEMAQVLRHLRRIMS